MAGKPGASPRPQRSGSPTSRGDAALAASWRRPLRAHKEVALPCPHPRRCRRAGMEGFGARLLFCLHTRLDVSLYVTIGRSHVRVQAGRNTHRAGSARAGRRTTAPLEREPRGRPLLLRHKRGWDPSLRRHTHLRPPRAAFLPLRLGCRAFVGCSVREWEIFSTTEKACLSPSA